MSKHGWNLNIPMATPSSTVPRNSSKKREFPSASSSSDWCNEVEVLEVPPLSHRKPSSSKNEAVSHKTIIDLDDDDDDDEVMIIEGNAGKRAKGKETFAVGSTSTANGAFDIDMPKHGGYGFSSNHDVECDPCEKSNMPTVYGLNMLEPSHGSSGFKSRESQNILSTVASAHKVDPEIRNKTLQRYTTFKKFDMVDDISDNKFWKPLKPQLSMYCVKKIQKEWGILENGLPDTIFVRASESRMDLLRAVIVGAEGTPYHDGLYFFDIQFPSNYPSKPPLVHYRSGGLKINPNLYKGGKVCLSLIGTWKGEERGEGWLRNKSTVLQVLVSIQGLILNAKPYFNEPGYEDYSGPEHDENAFVYNEEVFTLSLKTMIYNVRRPPKHFEDFVAGYFCKYGRDILVCCKAYMDGAQVGCLFKGGVQDVDEGDKSSSQNLKNHLAALITNAVNAFSQIGAKNCEEFLSLAQKATGPPETFLIYHQ